MARLKLLITFASAAFIAASAAAQVSTGTSAQTDGKSQFIRPGDVSPEEYSRLLAEADRIRAYQAKQSTATVTYNAANNSGYYSGTTQPQTYAEYMAAKQREQQASQSQQQPIAPAQPTYVSQSQQYANTGTPTSQGQQPVYVQQAPLPQNQTYQAPTNNQLVYATMPNVVGTSAPTAVMPSMATYAVPQGAHSVVKGDTLYALSRKYGVALNTLKQANGLLDNTISIGQNLVIPARQQTVLVNYAAPAQSTVNTQVQYRAPSSTAYVSPTYKVPTSVNTTQMGSRTIKAVQPVPASGVYAVLPKDTLYGISRFACVKATDVASLNGISEGAVLQPGQKLQMPSGHCLN